MDAVKTPIGYVPNPEDINLDGISANVTTDTVRDLLTVDTDAWLEDIENIKQFYEQVGSHVPAELKEELEALSARLKA